MLCLLGCSRKLILQQNYIQRRLLLSTQEAVRDISTGNQSTEFSSSDRINQLSSDKPNTTEFPSDKINELSADKINTIKTICARYSPHRQRIELPYSHYVALRKRMKIYSILSGAFSYCGLCMFISFQAPNFLPASWLGPEPQPLMELGGIDPMFVVIGGTAVASSLGALVIFSKWTAIHLWLLRRYNVENREIKKQFYFREKDFQRRCNFYRCTEMAQVGQHDDFYGDKIKDLSDYRYWIRIQQIKKENAEKEKSQKSKSANS